MEHLRIQYLQAGLMSQIPLRLDNQCTQIRQSSPGLGRECWAHSCYWECWGSFLFPDILNSRTWLEEQGSPQGKLEE